MNSNNKPATHLINLAMFSVSILVSIFLGEFLVRIVAPQNLSGIFFEQTEKGLSVNKSKGSAMH